MSQETKQFNITAAPGVSEVIIREGKAAPIVLPSSVLIDGDIFTPGNFVAHRAVLLPVKDTHVFIDRKNLKIRLISNERFPSEAYEVRGELFMNPELKELKINEDKMFSLSELTKLLKFKRNKFSNNLQYGHFMSALADFKTSSTTDVQMSKDNRGYVNNSFKKVAQTDIPLDFVLEMPLYEGLPASTFRVEVCLDVTDGGTKFWLESLELKELLESVRDQIFDSEKAKFSDYLVIER